MPKVKIRKIKKGFRGAGDEYSLNDTIFLIGRPNRGGFLVYDKSIGISSGQEIFRLRGYIDYRDGMSQFRQWLQNSKYAVSDKGKSVDV